MYVCICNGVTDHQIREAAANGCRSVAELTMRTGCGATCGSCLEIAAALLEPARDERTPLFPVPVLGLSLRAA
ncbi:MAG TPA: (2Fe-2S)-binding protein [Pseudoxanthomonas sp.]